MTATQAVAFGVVKWMCTCEGACEEEEEEEQEEEGVWRKERSELACLCCDPSFFFLPCLLEGTKGKTMSGCRIYLSLQWSRGSTAWQPSRREHQTNLALSHTQPAGDRCIKISYDWIDMS